MKILKSWLQDHIVETLPSDEIIAEAFISKSSEVEGIEKVKLGDKEDTVFDLKVLPDRAHYMLSHRGVAYDLCAILNLTIKNVDTVLPNVNNFVKVNLDSTLCNRYNAVSISNITNSQSPEWLKSRLEAIGARSINAIVDATNYSMFDTGQPLHAFDSDKLSGGISIRFANEGESMETLDGKIINLKKHHLIIADDNGPLAIAGVKGGKRAEVTLSTKNIILESASFNPVSVRRTSFEVNIRNDSSKRFENEITSHLTEKGISKFLEIIEKISPEITVNGRTDSHSVLPQHWTIKLNHKNIESVLNLKITEERVTEILFKLDCRVVVNGDEYEVTPPLERLDLIIAEDIIDEIGRIEGLDKVQSIVPNVKTVHSSNSEFIVTEKIKDFLVSKDFDEIQTRTFTNKGDIEVAYPMASDKGFLRTSLAENISNSVTGAIRNSPLLGLDKVQIFEIGKTFPLSGEQTDLCIAIDYSKKIKNKDQQIKVELEALLSELESNIGVKFNSKIMSNYLYISNIEKLDLKLDIKSINLEKGSRNQFIQFSREPFIVRDIALFVDSVVNSDDVGNVIKDSVKSVAGDLVVKGPNMFDQFEKEGKKSLAFRIIFQAADRTLTDDEVNKFMENVYATVKDKGWQVR